MALRRKGARGQRGHDLFPGFTDVVEIGVGTLAVVFRAREMSTHRQVALKLLNVRDISPQSIESFERESIALGALSSHPNIVTLYRTFRTADGRPVLVLELCTGAVADRIHAGAAVPVPEAVSIGIKIAGALETAHRGGILHRDVKPQNILVTEFGEPALADFGVAMLQSATQTTAGLFDFTTLHAAPELLEGGGTSAATDVYELASSLYQLIAGRSAFRAYEGESPASVILRILRDPVRPLSGVDVPMELSDLLIRAMSKQMDERPPTAAEFAAELAEVEIAQGWNRTQFLIRDPGPLGTGIAPAVTRLPDAVPRGLPSTLAPSRPLDPQAIERLRARLADAPHEPVVSAEPAPAPVVEPEPAPAEVVEPDPAPEQRWSQPTLVESRGWSAPPAGGPRRPAPVPAPPPDTWWSAPPAARHAAPTQVPEPEPAAPEPAPAGAAPTQYQPPDWYSFAPPARDSAPAGAAADAAAPAPPDAEPAPAPPSRPRRVPVDIDDDFFPARRPPGPDQLVPVPEQPAGTGAVPVWAVRAPTPAPSTPAAFPQFSSDLSLDPMSLRRKATVRSGASAVQVDDKELRLRTWLRRTAIAWSDVQGFEAHVDPLADSFDDGPSSPGQLVAITSGGPVELPGTRRPMSELRYVHALLDAYRIRAQRLANQ